MTPLNRRITQLISRQILGELTADESQELEQWRQESEDNERFYLRVTAPDFMRRKTEGREAFDISPYRRNFERTIGMRRYRLRRIGWQVAAVAAVLVVLGATIWLERAPKEQEAVIAETISPGSNKAILVLNDGRSFDLDDDNAIEVREGDGICVVSDSHTISYTEETTGIESGLRNKIIIPTAGEYRLQLSDGTKVFLNAESEIEYPVRFSGDKREVVLKGEAHFEVSASDEWPFIVKSGDVDVLVTGTEFNVKAYPDEDVIQMTLLHGRITVLSGEQKRERVNIEPNQQAEWSRSGQSLTVKEVDPELFFAWKNGRFIFWQERLEDIMRTLARWYDIEVVYRDESLKDMRFAGRLERSQEITPILNIMRATDKITVEVSGRQIIFGR